MEEILSAQATLQSACAMWADDYAPDLVDTLCAVNDKGLGRVAPGASCGRPSVFLVVSGSSSLALTSGGAKSRHAAARTFRTSPGPSRTQ